MKKNKSIAINASTPRVSKDGREFSLVSSVWELNKDVKVHVGWAKQLKSDVKDSYLEALSYYAENFSAGHAYNMNSRAKAYFKSVNDSEILIDSLISYRSTLSKTSEHYLGALRGFIKKWHELGYIGVSDEVISLLNRWTLKGNVKGRAVATMDETKGPLTDIEMQALLDGLLSGYMRGDVQLEDYALISTLAHTGRRAVQIVSLKHKDLQRKKTSDIDEYWINFPRAKQRNSTWRQEFNAYPITEDLWLILELQAKNVIKQVQAYTNLTIDKNTIKELPLFPNIESFTETLSHSILHDQLMTDYHHARSASCNDALKHVSSSLNILSERTGKPLNLQSKRFRYTLGTNLAREGKGEYIIAEALDHTDMQNTGVYVRNLPDIVERIDKAVALQLAPLAQAFQGVLITSEKEAIRGNDKTSRISNGRNNVGSCGSYGFCGAIAPIACYTCSHFQPWLEGPHEEVLEELLAKRNQVLEVTEDKKIASVNDRLILAVSDVIQRCQKMKSQNIQLLEDKNA